MSTITDSLNKLRKYLPARRDAVMVTVLIVLSLLLWKVDLFSPTMQTFGAKLPARVLAVDNSNVSTLGLAYRGTQHLEVEIIGGKRAGERFKANNELISQMELDKLFEVGDTALVGVLDTAQAGVDSVNAQDHYRVNHTVLLFSLFALLLICFAGYTGFNALLSFVFSCLVIWKLVIPLCLQGVNALLVTFLAVLVLSAVIILLVAGLTKKGFTALIGALLGVFASCLTGWIFTGLFKINGAVMPYSQALLHSGFEYLNLSEIYIGAIFLSSSGAVMDLAMDVASGIEEVSLRRSGLSNYELLRSGLRIGRSVVGTMTTTLLLAYSGGYLTLMMMFAVQGTGPIDFINNPYVASEAVKTLVGSFGLVLVAPFTAAVGAWIFAPKKN